MAIKNYTSKVSAYESIGEIQKALATHGAAKIMIDYEQGKPVALTFALPTPRGLQAFRLPAAVEGTIRVFKQQGVKCDPVQAEMTAWRNVRDWVLAQMALIESCDVPMDQVFFPYLTNANGDTLYEAYVAGYLPAASSRIEGDHNPYASSRSPRDHNA